MTDQDKSKNAHTGFGEWAAPPWQHEGADKSLDQLFLRMNEREEKKKSLYIKLGGGALALLIVTGAFWFSQKGGGGWISVSNSKNTSIISNAGNVVINNAPINIRQWNDLDSRERDQVREELLQQFPEIRTKSRMDWRPVTKWLAEEKGIITPSPRDMFR